MKNWALPITACCLGAALLSGCGNEEVNRLNEPDTINEPVDDSVADPPEAAEPENVPADDGVDEEASSAQDQSSLSIGDTALVESNVQTFNITLNNVRFVEDYEGSLSEFHDFAIVEYTVENLADDMLDAYEAIDIFELDGMTDSSGAVDGFEPISGQLQTGDTATGEAIYYAYDEADHTISVRPGVASVGGIDDISWEIERTSAD